MDLAQGNQDSTQMRGALTELDLPLAENEFPGITAFYEACQGKPQTFLELLFAFAD